MTRKYQLLCVCFSKYKKQNCTIVIDKQHNIRKVIHNRKHVCHFVNTYPNGSTPTNFSELKNPYISTL